MTDVVRGQDLFWSTSVHRLLQALLGLPAPAYHHHRLILDADGRKLSKSTPRHRPARIARAGATPADIRRMVGLAELMRVCLALAPAWQSAAGWRDARSQDAKAATKRRGRKRRPQRRAIATPRAIEAALAALAHDIRTPLTGILALGELLATSDLAERERELGQAIRGTAEHLAVLTIADRRRGARPSQGARAAARAVLAAPACRALALRSPRAPQPRGSTADVAIADDLPDAVIGDGCGCARRSKT